MIRVLRPDYRIEQLESGFCLQSQIYPKIKWILPKFAALVLSLYNGMQEDELVEQSARYLFENKVPKFDNWFANIVKQHQQFLIPVSKAKKLFDGNYPRYEATHLIIGDKETPQKPMRIPAPKFLSIYITEYCIRQCRYCYAHPKTGNIAEEQTMSLDKFKMIIHEAFELGIEKILLTGGEPLYSPYAYDLIEYATSLHIPVQIATKMRVQFDKLVKADVSLLDIGFSMDSHIQKTANFLTGSQSFFSDMMYNITEMKRLGIPFTVDMVLSKANYEHFQQTIDFLLDCGAEKIYTGHYVSEKHDEQDKDLLLDEDTKDGIDKKIKLMCEQPRYHGVVSNKPNKMDFTSDIKTIHCNTGINRITVKFDGRYVYCEKLIHHDSMLFSNVYENGLREIWNSSDLRELMYPSRSLYGGTICEKCLDFDCCTGKNGCYWISYGEHGRFFKPIEEIEYVCIKNKNLPRV